jgi:restriction system protein
VNQLIIESDGFDGFTKEATYEADRANNQVSLIDSDELVNLIIHYYDNFDAEARSLLPLENLLV